MPETPPSGFQNKRLLLVAILMGLLFVALYYWQQWQQQREQTANRVYFVRLKTDLEAGQNLSNLSVEAVPIPKEYAEGLTGMVKWEEIKNGVDSQVVYRRVQRSHFLEWQDISPEQSAGNRPSRDIPSGWQVYPLPVDSKSVPRSYIRRYVRVDVSGAVSIKGRPSRSQLIIEALEVRGADGQINIDPEKRDFRSLDVLVPADLVPLLDEVRRRVVGSLTITVRGDDDRTLKFPYDKNDTRKGGRIADPVKDSLVEPFAPATAAPAEPPASPTP